MNENHKEPLSSKHRKSGNMIKTANGVILSTRLQKHSNNNNKNNNNNHDNVYGAVIMAEPLREFTRFI